MLTLNYIFNLSILVGFVIPLITILTGWFGNTLGSGASVDVDVDLDVDVDVDVDVDLSADAAVDSGGVGGGIIPFNLKCLCFSLVVFGAVGHMLERFMSTVLFTILMLAACLLAAGLAYFALYHLLIKRLKQNDASALSYNNLRGRSATVTLPVTADRLGTISLKDTTGAAISFRAKIDPDLKRKMPETLQAGEAVVITGADREKKLCYVSLPLNKFVRGGVEGSERTQEK